MKPIRIAMLALLGLAKPALAAGPDIADAWLAEPPPGPGTLAIYFTLRNAGAVERVLDGARVEGAGKAEVHTHDMSDGVMRMRPAGPLPVPAGGELLLQPGGLHLMVFDAEPRPVAGQRLPFCLHFDDATEVCAEAVVRRVGQ